MTNIKLKITTKHTLPLNNKVSLFEQMRSEALSEADEALSEILDGGLAPDDPSSPFPDDGYEESGGDVPFDGEEFREEMLRRLDALLDECFRDAEDNTGRYILTTEAVMDVTPAAITLSYDEAPGSDLGNTHSIIRIDRAHPHSLSIERSGSLMNTIVCETGRRHTSVYTSPLIPAPLEVCTFTRRCDIDLDEDGGVIFLDYIIEIRGADVQRTQIRMDVSLL